MPQAGLEVFVAFACRSTLGGWGWHHRARDAMGMRETGVRHGVREWRFLGRRVEEGARMSWLEGLGGGERGLGGGRWA